jgi:SH3-like domain-containing protein
MKNNLIYLGCALLAFVAMTSETSAAEATGSLSTPNDVAVTVTGGTIATVSTIVGTPTAATSVTISGSTSVAFNPTGDVRVTIPASTVITPVGGGTFDSTAIAAVAATVTTLPAGESSNGALTFGISGVGLRFSTPIRIDIPVPGVVASTIAVKVQHNGSSAFVTTGLTNDPNATCTAGVPSVPSATATVANAVATIYTCEASTFAAYTTVTVGGGSTTGGGGGSYAGSYVAPATTIVTTTTTDSGTTVQTPVKKTIKKLIPKKVKVTTTQVMPTGTERVTKVNRVNIRAAADPRSKLLGYFTRNAKVVVISQSGNWVEVKTDQITGWVLAVQLWDLTSEEAEALMLEAMKVPPYTQVTAIGRVNVWSAPTTKSKFLGYMGSKVEVTVTEKDPTGWVKITSKYFTGWVKASMLKDAK